MIAGALLLFHTVRKLRLKQIIFRVYYLLVKPTIPVACANRLRCKISTWHEPQFRRPATEDGFTFEFLNRSHSIDSDWNIPNLAKLWLYNLHYHDDLCSINSSSRREVYSSMLDRWVLENPPLEGNGWEPYCISLRVVNWIKWFAREPRDSFTPRLQISLSLQADILIQRIEYHILGNHLLANAKALVFLGVFFGGAAGEYFLSRGLKIIDEELGEQFLPDGGHFELSPMYHAIVIWDLADLINLSRLSGIESLLERVVGWESKLAAGIEWLEKMVHPDGGISFFNDAAMGVAPSLKNLNEYLNMLEISVNSTAQGSMHPTAYWLKSSGFIIFEWGDAQKCIVDVGHIGPDYQPGHAHADTLSFELSLFAKRIFVNSGVSEYASGIERRRQRSTSAHNTVVVDGQDSSQVWSAFRVAKRAKPIRVALDESRAGRILLTAAHDGYVRLTENVVHERIFDAIDGAILITDRLIGDSCSGEAHWHLHPDIQVCQRDGAKLILQTASGERIYLTFSDEKFVLKSTTWHPSFGITIPTYKLVSEVNVKGSWLKIEWKF